MVGGAAIGRLETDAARDNVNCRPGTWEAAPPSGGRRGFLRQSSDSRRHSGPAGSSRRLSGISSAACAPVGRACDHRSSSAASFRCRPPAMPPPQIAPSPRPSRPLYRTREEDGLSCGYSRRQGSRVRIYPGAMKAETACTRKLRFPLTHSVTVMKRRCLGSHAIGGVLGIVKSRLSSGRGISSTSSGSTASVPLMPAMQRTGGQRYCPLHRHTKVWGVVFVSYRVP